MPCGSAIEKEMWYIPEDMALPKSQVEGEGSRGPEFGQGCGTYQLIWCKVGNTWHEVITALITKFHVLAALRCCQRDVKPFPYPGAWRSVNRENPSFHQSRGDGISARRCLASGRAGHFLELLLLASPGLRSGLHTGVSSAHSKGFVLRQL